MAKKNIAGVGGNIAMPTDFNAKLGSWSATYTIDDEEVTGFDSAGFREFEPVAISVTGSASGTLQYDDSNAKPLPAALADGAVLTITDLALAKATITLTFQTGCTWAFTAIVTGLAVDRPATGRASITFDFKSSGPITQAWDESA